MNRAKLLLSAALLGAGMPSPGLGQDPARSDVLHETLDVVVDSLPWMLWEVTGYAEDASSPVVLLSARLHATRGRPRAQHGLQESAPHDPTWLNEQRAKPGILRTCADSDIWECSSADAQMVVAISAPSIVADSAWVEVAMRRQGGGPPGKLGTFFAQVLLTLWKDGAMWRVGDLRILGIT